MNQKPRVCADRARRPIISTLQTRELLVRALLLVVGAWHKSKEDPAFGFGMLVPVLRDVWIEGTARVRLAAPSVDAVPL